MTGVQQLTLLAGDLIEDIQDGFAINLVIPPGGVEHFIQDMLAGQGGKLPIQIQVDPQVDTPKEE